MSASSSAIRTRRGAGAAFSVFDPVLASVIGSLLRGLGRTTTFKAQHHRPQPRHPEINYGGTPRLRSQPSYPNWQETDSKPVQCEFRTGAPALPQFKSSF